MVFLKIEDFGSHDNEAVKKFTWQTASGLQVSVISFGAIIQAIKMFDKNGVYKDITLGFDDLEGYVKRNTPYLGSTCGRCVNRIANGTFQIDGVTYNLAKNNGKNHLHGGVMGFDKVNWKYMVDGNKVVFSYLSKDGDENYPGDLVTNAIYEVTDDDVLHLEFIATTTMKTICNITNHSYFNLAGDAAGAEELFKHIMIVNADRVTENDDTFISTGKFIKVAGTIYDLRTPRPIGDAIKKSEELYHHNYCIDNYDEKKLNFVSRVIHPASGRYLEVYSNQPGVQIYTANHLGHDKKETVVGKNGVTYPRFGGFCVEPQIYPDAINHHNFPNVILKPGDVYNHKLQYRFGVEKADVSA